MKTWKLLAVFLAIVCLSAPNAGAQSVAAYGTFSATLANDAYNSNTLYGGTTGLLLTQIVGDKRFDLNANIQGRFVRASGFNIDSLTFGPRVQTPRVFGMRPYAEFLVGFGRVYVASQSPAKTDSTIELNGGITRRLSSHLDLTADFSYSQLYAYGGAYNPKTISVGAVYYFSRRELR